MTKKTKTLVGLIALFAAVAYVALPYDIDGNWYGYIDDFFVLWLATHSLCQHAVNQCVRHNFWE